jgi:hypothetical protein
MLMHANELPSNGQESLYRMPRSEATSPRNKALCVPSRDPWVYHHPAAFCGIANTGFPPDSHLSRLDHKQQRMFKDLEGEIHATATMRGLEYSHENLKVCSGTLAT